MGARRQMTDRSLFSIWNLLMENYILLGVGFGMLDNNVMDLGLFGFWCFEFNLLFEIWYLFNS